MIKEFKKNLHEFSQYYRAASDPIRRIVQGAKNSFKYTLHFFSVANIKHQLGVMQTKSIPELIIGFFKSIFYAFYYSGYGVTAIIKYLLINVLMSLMRGPPEEVTEEVPTEEDRFGMTALALPAEETTTTMQAFGLDINKEESGQFKMAPHESQSSPTTSEETGESSPEDGSGEQTDPNAETEQPMTLVSEFFSF